MNEVNSFSEQISTEDTELSSADVSVNVLSHKTKSKLTKKNFLWLGFLKRAFIKISCLFILNLGTEGTPIGSDLKTNCEVGTTGALSSPSQVSMEKDQPQLLHAPKSSSSDTFTSNKTQKSQKTKGAHNEADESGKYKYVFMLDLRCLLSS